MLKMSFYDGTLNRVTAKEVIEKTDKTLMYRYGYAYRGAEKRPITKEAALKIVSKEMLLDIDESESEIVLNAYSSNDMW